MSAPNESLPMGGREGSGTYQFGPFFLDKPRRLLLKDGAPVTLTPKTYDTMLVLVESRGSFLSKEQLMKALWPASFVEDSNLTQQISMVRKALGESAGEDRYVVTVPGRGYRFVAAVIELPSDSAPGGEIRRQQDLSDVSQKEPQLRADSLQPDTQEELQLHPIAGSAKAPPRVGTLIRRPRVILPIFLALALVAAGYWLYTARSLKTESFEPPRSLAILPFRNLKLDPQSDFLSFSLADAVITKLSYVTALTVRPSSSVERYRNQAIDSRRVAADLDVDTLLTGNFIREGDDLRITAELIDVKKDRILWRDAFDLKYEKLLTVQDRVAQHIVEGLELKLSPDEARELGADRPVDPLAYEYYLRGVELYARSEYAMAIKMLEKSSEINPAYALTWAHLGRAYNATASFQFGGSEQYRRAQAAYEKALSLQPAQIDTRVYMANMFTDTGRVEQAVPLLREALRTNANHAEAHWELGYAYRFAGALKESVLECERARQLDPGVKLTSSALNGYLYLGQYDRFLESLPKLENSALIVFYRGLAEYYQQKREPAARDFDHAFELDPSLLHAQVGKALSYGITQQPSKGLEILHAAEDRINERNVGDPEAIYKIAQAYAMLGDKPSALRVFRYSVENGFFSYPYFEADPLLSGLRSTSEFESIMAVAMKRYEAFKGKFLWLPRSSAR